MVSRLLFSALLALASARAIPSGHHVRVKRQITELRDSYDFIIAGGGTAGLTIADRLTAAFPDRAVLVIEPGELEFATGVFEPPGAPPGAGRQMLVGKPMPAMNNRTQTLQLGRTVGGSSAVNGQFFDRGCKWDFDDWKTLGEGDELWDESEEVWDWDGIIEWYKKSVTFTEPTEEDVEAIGYTWDYEAAYGGDTPVHSSFPPFQWPIQASIWQAWVEAGVAVRKECAAGDKDGICWVPTSQNPWDGTRATSRTGHYDPVIEDRDNYDLLVKHKVVRVTYDPDFDSPPSVEVLPLDVEPESPPSDDDEEGEEEPAEPVEPATFMVKSSLEVIISAGAIHTPQILQLSGFGPSNILSTAGIDVIHELPGVGYNFHDHGGVGVTYRVNTSSFSPSQADMSNETFAAAAEELYALRPAQGPYTTAMGNSAVYVPLTNITAKYGDITAAIRAQVADGVAADFLEPGTPESVVKGYEAQLLVFADALDNPRYPILETPFSSGFTGLGFLLKPLSRGTVHINPDSPYDEPLIDWATGANPLDLEVMASFIPFFRRFFSGETISALGPREIQPGADVTEMEDLIAYVRRTAQSSFMHPCCTAAMLPFDKGGVVGPDLKVHGLGGLRVVDASIFPTLPGTHTSATVYAIAEKAADIIIRQNKPPETADSRRDIEASEK